MSDTLKNAEVTDMITVRGTCPFCGKEQTIMVDKSGYDKWMGKNGMAGAMVQDAFPHLTPSQREILMTGMCDDCFPK